MLNPSRAERNECRRYSLYPGVSGVGVIKKRDLGQLEDSSRTLSNSASLREMMRDLLVRASTFSWALIRSMMYDAGGSGGEIRAAGYRVDLGLVWLWRNQSERWGR